MTGALGPAGVVALLALVQLAPRRQPPRAVAPQPTQLTMQQQQTGRSDFARRIDGIASRAGDLTAPDALFRDREFRQIYEAPTPFRDAAAALYADRAEPALHKAIAGYAMQRLATADLVWLVSHVADLTRDRLVAPVQLEQLAFPLLNWGVRLRVEYDRPEVRALLERLAGQPEVSARTRAYIRDEVLTGRAREDIEEMRAAGQIP